MVHDPLVVLRLSPAQARVVNHALAVLDAEDDDDLRVSRDVLDRTRTKVHDAMDAVGVSP